MSNNTLKQRIIKKYNATVDSNGNVSMGSAVELDHFETVGSFICNGTTPVTVTEPKIGTTSSIIITLQTVGGTVGAVPAIQTITPGTGFTVKGTASDTSTYIYCVIA